MEESKKIIIIGAGAAGLSAALELAKNGVKSVLVSDMPSARAQSVMAEGGINAAFPSDPDSFASHEEDSIGKGRNLTNPVREDSPALHAEETLRAGRYLADPFAVRGLTENAPEIIKELFAEGMSFTLNNEGQPDVRAFGGQSVKRTYYAAAGTGKQLMNTLAGQIRRYEADGTIRRMTGCLFLHLVWEEDQVCGCVLANVLTGEETTLCGRVIITSGGLNGMFGNATGSVKNTGGVTASLFADGVAIANGEFIQYHPTTVRLYGKNMLITEAVRGEGGRLLTLRGGRPYYFMEEKYPELGNLMPRDVIAREEWALMEQGEQIYLDMRHLDEEVQQNKLRGVIEDCRQFLSLDPTKELIPVVPGIHYFMGGIRVDCHHRTNSKGLYAAGECACQYHGANRLGGNSLLGAIYGGKTAARSAMEDSLIMSDEAGAETGKEETGSNVIGINVTKYDVTGSNVAGSYVDGMLELRRILQEGLGIVRDGETLKKALTEITGLGERLSLGYDPSASAFENNLLRNCCLLGKALLLSAAARKESRGAHTRSDFPEECMEYQKQTVARLVNGQIRISFESAGEEDAY